jgi:hypothetical protein
MPARAWGGPGFVTAFVREQPRAVLDAELQPGGAGGSGRVTGFHWLQQSDVVAPDSRISGKPGTTCGAPRAPLGRASERSRAAITRSAFGHGARPRCWGYARPKPRGEDTRWQSG